MPKFSANLSMLFTEVPFLDRFALAAKAGFNAVEFLFPYDHPASEIRQRLDDHGLQLVLQPLLTVLQTVMYPWRLFWWGLPA